MKDIYIFPETTSRGDYITNHICTEEAHRELQAADVRPELAEKLENINSYDTFGRGRIQ
jgi:hypothetical protein